MWLTDPEGFRKEAERTNNSQMLSTMRNPPRRDREQFLAWANGKPAR
jgi:hypothetical protein